MGEAIPEKATRMPQRLAYEPLQNYGTWLADFLATRGKECTVIHNFRRAHLCMSREPGEQGGE